ncbi:MAG: LytR/AlgR family response regulator transcription factor [Chitinophagaceae bacterium]
MLNVVIIEDERPATENLMSILSSIAWDLNVTACLGSVKESMDFFSHKPQVDLIFSDVQLNDGLCFEIFNREEFCTPVIFITGYDEFILKAFENNGIDFLLKPVDRQRLDKALAKYRMLGNHFNDQHSIACLLHAVDPGKKKRMIVKNGMQSISLLLNDIVLFQTESKWAFAIDRFGKKYMVDKNLSELEMELDEHLFFRANRQQIIHINYIHGFMAYDRVKIKVELTIPEIKYPVIVSQELVPQFREWMFKA